MNARWLSILFALPLLACGGEEGTRAEPAPLCRPILPLTDQPDPGSGPVDCQALDGYEIYLLNNFETGEYSAGWYMNNDRTAAQYPPPDSDPVPTTPIVGGRCVGAEPTANAATFCEVPETPRGECTDVRSLESRSAIRIQSGFLSSNGGVFGHITSKTCVPIEEAPACAFLPGPPEVGPCSEGMAPSPPRPGCRAAHDTSDWDGILVWARVGPNSPSAIRIRASDEVTDDKACICNSFTNQNDTSDGCDKFGKFVNLDGTFRAHLIPFDEMQQGGWGLPSPGLDRGNLFEVVVEYGRGAWDLWIDDIGLYRRRAP